jgi:NAD-dependent histone deacetylase SIR2
MRKVIETGEVPLCPQCQGIVKPDIVFFGEALPEDFFLNRTLPAAADLCIVMGTSLSVQPFASLPGFCKEGVPRVLINMERVGGLGSRPDDVLLLGDIDAGVRKFAKTLGWLEELEALWEATNPDKAVRDAENAPLKTRDERLKDEVDRLTSEVDRQLHISEKYEEKVREKLNQPDKTAEVQNAAASALSLAGKAPLGVSSGIPNGISSRTDEGVEKIRQLRASDACTGHGNLAHVYPHLARKPSSL